MGPQPSDREKRQEIYRVRSCIRFCMKRNKSKQKTIDLLAKSCNIEAAITREVWEKLEEVNQEIFSAYYRRLAVLSALRVKMSYKIKSKALVLRYIERCIQNAMGKNETINFLATHCNIDAASTRAGWEQLEQENRPLLRAYYSVIYAVESSNNIESDIQAIYNHQNNGR